MEPFPCWKAARRSFPPDDPFFVAGNVERELQAKQVSLNISEAEKEMIGRAENEECWSMSCPIVGCGARLKGLEQLESHYVLRHTATCSVCSHVYPTKRLLSIHISETHDSFFQAKVARNHPMYECLVEGCPGVFLNDKARHQHLIDKHKFPAAFRFHKKRHLSQKQRRRLHSKEKPNVGKANVVQQTGTGDENSMAVDELSSAISRLSTAEAKVPDTISFGRRRGKVVVPTNSRSR